MSVLLNGHEMNLLRSNKGNKLKKLFSNGTLFNLPSYRSHPYSSYSATSTFEVVKSTLNTTNYTHNDEEEIPKNPPTETVSRYKRFRKGPIIHNKMMKIITADARALPHIAGQIHSLKSELLTAIDDHNHFTAWYCFTRLRNIDGYSRPFVGKMLLNIAYSADRKTLRKGLTVVYSVLRKRACRLFSIDSVSLLCLSLCRHHMIVEAGTLLRLMLKEHLFPHTLTFRSIFMHFVASENGTFIACDILEEICSLRAKVRLNNKYVLERHKPSIVLFNMVMKSCLDFGMFRKGLEVVDMMHRSKLFTPDVCTLLFVAKIYEKNCCRKELIDMKSMFTSFTPGMPVKFHILQCQQFYSSLLRIYCDLDELDFASELVLELLKKQISKDFWKVEKEKHRNRKWSRRVEKEPAHVLPIKADKHLIRWRKWMFRPTDEVYAMISSRYLCTGRPEDLIRFLLIADRLRGSQSALCRQVLQACIEEGWVDHAYLMIRELRDLCQEKSADVRLCKAEKVDPDSSKEKNADVNLCQDLYGMFLTDLCKRGQVTYIGRVLRDLVRAGFQIHGRCFGDMIKFGASTKDLMVAENFIAEKHDAVINNDTSLDMKVYLKGFLRDEMGSHTHSVLARLKEINNSMRYFRNMNMLDDARDAYSFMTKTKGIQPSLETYEYLIDSYADRKRYNCVPYVWSDIRRMAMKSARNQTSFELKFDRHFLDKLTCCFIAGFYFRGALEVMDLMEEQNMFVDKTKYRLLFLKFHKRIYRLYFTSNVSSEVQLLKMQHISKFKKRVGIVY